VARLNSPALPPLVVGAVATALAGNSMLGRVSALALANPGNWAQAMGRGVVVGLVAAAVGDALAAEDEAGDLDDTLPTGTQPANVKTMSGKTNEHVARMRDECRG
jgi:hypothetical protein